MGGGTVLFEPGRGARDPSSAMEENGHATTRPLGPAVKSPKRCR
jgi:hypothetical protein